MDGGGELTGGLRGGVSRPHLACVVLRLRGQAHDQPAGLGVKQMPSCSWNVRCRGQCCSWIMRCKGQCCSWTVRCKGQCCSWIVRCLRKGAVLLFQAAILIFLQRRAEVGCRDKWGRSICRLLAMGDCCSSLKLHSVSGVQARQLSEASQCHTIVASDTAHRFSHTAVVAGTHCCVLNGVELGRYELPRLQGPYASQH